jgi:hypothetical protein
VNPGRTSHFPGCVSTGGRAGRRKAASLRWCAAGPGRPVRAGRERRWAGAASATTPVQPGPITVRVRTDEPIAADQVSSVTRPAGAAGSPGHPARPADVTRPNPRPCGPIRRSAVLPTALAAAARDSLVRTLAQADTVRARARLAGAWIRLAYVHLMPGRHERLADWTARCVQQLGDLVFALEDAEATWHAWNVEPRYAGLGRLYRDQRFDALVACPRCHRVSTVAGSAVCKQCSAADLLVRT